MAERRWLGRDLVHEWNVRRRRRTRRRQPRYGLACRRRWRFQLRRKGRHSLAEHKRLTRRVADEWNEPCLGGRVAGSRLAVARDRHRRMIPQVGEKTGIDTW